MTVVDSHDDAGLVATGGTLDTETLISAYRAGIFPWSSDPVISWWSPDPRAIFDLDDWRPHRSTARSARRAGWRFTVDQDFTGVMRACAAPGPDAPVDLDHVRLRTLVRRAAQARARPQRRGVGGRRTWSAGSTASRWADSSAASRCSTAPPTPRRRRSALLIERLRAGGFTLLRRAGADAAPRGAGRGLHPAR